MIEPGARRRTSASAAEALLWALVLALPLSRGGVDGLVLAACALVAGPALLFALHARNGSGLPLPWAAAGLGAGAVFALATCVPLPSGLVGLLAPRARSLATLPPETEPSWIPLSLDPPATALDAARLLALAAIVITAAALSRREQAARRLGMAVALSGVGVLAVGAVHALGRFPRYFGLFEPGSPGPLPLPFVNPNHAASLATLSALAALGLWRASTDRSRAMLWALAAFGSTALALSTFSVGGVAALAAGGALFLLLDSRRNGTPVGRSAAFAAVMLVLAFAALLVAGAEGVVSEVRERDFVASAKWQAWPGTLALIGDHWLVGVGRGAFGPAFAAYAPLPGREWITHPENVVLHWAAEWGVPAALLGLLLLLATLFRGGRASTMGDSTSPICAGLFAGAVAVLLHDLVDFGLEFAGVGVPFAVALGVMVGRLPPARRLSRMAGITLAVTAVGAGITAATMLPRQAEAEIARLTAERSLSVAELDASWRAVRRRHPADPLVALTAADALTRRAMTGPREERGESFRRALPYLARSQETWRSAQPHLVTGRVLAMAGRRAQALTELRRALLLGGRSVEEVVLEEALRLGASGEELASFPAAFLLDAEAIDPRRLADPSKLVGRWLHHLLRRDLTEQARSLAEHSLDRLDLPAGPEFFQAACAALLSPCEGCGAPAPVERALALGESFVARRPADERGYQCLAQARVHLGDQEGARQALEEGISRVRHGPHLRIDLARLHLHAGRTERALKVLEGASEAGDAEVAARLRSTRVQALWAAGRRSRALAEAQEATRLYPDRAWSHRLLARQHERQDDFSPAIEALTAAERVARPAEAVDLAAWRARLEARRAATLAGD